MIAVECEKEAALVGVMGEDGFFRSEFVAAFDPRHTTYVCPDHRIESYIGEVVRW